MEGLRWDDGNQVNGCSANCSIEPTLSDGQRTQAFTREHPAQLGGTQALRSSSLSVNVMLDEQFASIAEGRVWLHSTLSPQSRKQ